MHRAYADTSFGQIHYFTAGSGPPLLMLHATNHSARTFSSVIPHLAEHYRVVAPDYLGFGFSDPLPPDVTMRDVTDSMVEVLDAVDADSAHVFGLHTGNKLGAALGANHAARVRKLILCGEPHSIIPDEAARNDAIADYVADDLREYPATEDGTDHLKEWADLQRRVGEAWWNPDILSAPGATAEDVDLLATHVLERLCMRGSLADIYAANFEYDWSAELPDVAVETLVLELARADELEAYGPQRERVASIVPDCRSASMEETDASVFYRTPETVADRIHAFLGG